jgi:hypothetical protein
MQKALIFLLLMVFEILIQQGVSELRDDSATRQDVQEAIEQAIEQSRTRPPP